MEWSKEQERAIELLERMKRQAEYKRRYRIYQKLMLKRARLAGILVTEEEIDEVIKAKQILKKYGM